MASLFARSRPRKPSTICEACFTCLGVPRKPATASLRYLSTASRPVAARHALDSEAAGSITTKAQLRNYSSAGGAGSISTRGSETGADKSENGAFLTRGSISAAVIPPEAQYARLVDRRLIALSGPDTAKFLQGLVTNNVDPQRVTPFYAAFLDARGRMLHDVFVWTHSDLHHQKEMIGAKGTGEWACYVEVDEAETSTLVKHLKRHRLRSKVDIRLVDEGQEAQVCAIWGGNEALEAVSGQSQVLAKLEDPRFIFHHTSQDTSDCKNMVRALVRPTDVPTQSSGHPEEYTRLRYTHGVIEGGEIPKETLPSNKGNSLPMEYNVDISQGIDFKKGCYVGQELTIRTKHTGVVRKRILPVALSHANVPLQEPHSSDQIPTLVTDFTLDPSRFESADIKQLDDAGKIKKGRATGKLISVAGNLGLALCRLEMMTPMKVSAEGGSWKPGVEFGIEDGRGEVVRVRPFLRDEWVARVRDMWDKKRERI